MPARADGVLDLSWPRAEARDCHAADGAGRPGIDPEAALRRLVPAGLPPGIAHDRRPMRGAQVNIAVRRFAGHGPHEALPDRSGLARIRQRCGAERFRRVSARAARACVAARIAEGEVVHIDGSPARADVSRDAVARRHADAAEAADGRGGPAHGGQGVPPTKPAAPPARATGPDASPAKDDKARRSEPSRRRRTAVDAEHGVGLDVTVTTGAVHDTEPVEERLTGVAAATGHGTRAAATDAGYAITRVSAGLEERGTEAVIPARAERPARKGAIPARRSRLDAENRLVRCPGGKFLRPRGKPGGKPGSDGSRHRRARIPDGRACRLRAPCFGPAMGRRATLLHKDRPAPPRRGRGAGTRAGATASAPSAAATACAWRASTARRGGLPRRGEDLARPRPRRSPRARQHADPGLPRRSRRQQPQAAGDGPLARAARNPRRVRGTRRGSCRRLRTAPSATASPHGRRSCRRFINRPGPLV